MTLLKPCPKPIRKKRTFKRSAPMESVPREDSEQRTVVEWLRWHKVLFSATANGIYTHPVSMSRMKVLGVAVGLPDILIFDPPPAYAEMGAIGVAIEMKRRKGGIVSDEQALWLEKLQKRKWICKIARGADEAIEFLELCGYNGGPRT